MNHTEHYNLNQWEASDKVLRTDFNADNAKLDAILSDKLRLVVGSYIGTGTYGEDHPNVIEVEDAERPPRVIIVTEDGNHRKAIFIRGTPKTRVLDISSAYDVNVIWTDKGVKWYGTLGNFEQLNYLRPDETFTYHYAVFI